MDDLENRVVQEAAGRINDISSVDRAVEQSSVHDPFGFADRIDEIKAKERSADRRSKLMLGVAGLVAVALPVYGMLTGDPAHVEYSKNLLTFETDAALAAIQVGAILKVRKLLSSRR